MEKSVKTISREVTLFECVECSGEIYSCAECGEYIFPDMEFYCLNERHLCLSCGREGR